MLFIHRNLGGRSSLASESRIAKEREFEGSLTSRVLSKETSWVLSKETSRVLSKGALKRVLSKEKTFKLMEMGTHENTRWRIKSLHI